MPVDKSETRVRRMFGEIAPRYDFLNHLLSFGIDNYWRWQTVRRLPPQGDAPMLDLCTGTGDLALAYAKQSAGGRKDCRSRFLPRNVGDRPAENGTALAATGK